MTNLVEVFLHDWQNCADGTLEGVIAQAKAAGVGLIIKSDDGGNWYPQIVAGKNTPVSTLVDACEQAGVPASCWGYAYMDDVPTWRNDGEQDYLCLGFAAEAQRAIETIQIAKPRRYYCDNEQEAEGRPSEGQQYVETVNSAVGKLPTELVSSCLPLPRYHQSGLYYQFGAQGGWTMAPQQYWCFWPTQPYGDPATLVQWWHEDAQTFGIPISRFYPSYCDSGKDGANYSITDAQLVAYLAALTQQQCPVVSVWAYDGMDAAAWARVANVVEWQLLADPRHQADLLIAQAKPLYDQGNALVAQALTILGA